MSTMGLRVDAEQLKVGRLAKCIADSDLLRWLLELRFQFYDLGARPSERVEDQHGHTLTVAVDVSSYFIERIGDDLAAGAAHVAQVATSIEVIHPDAGTWHDVVKMIEQQTFP